MEADGDAIPPEAREAFYEYEGVWAAHIVDPGARRSQMLLVLRRLGDAKPADLLRQIRCGAAIAEGTRVEVEQFSAQLESAGATVKLVCVVPPIEVPRRATSVEARLRPFESMWTTERERYGLREVGPGAWLVFDLAARAPMVIDADADVIAAIIANMLNAAVRILERTPPDREDTRGQ